jgi:transglutaminase-like putative cysteine protease
MFYLNHSATLRLPNMLLHSASLVVLALPVAVAIFMLFPRIPAGILGLPNDSHGGITGMSETMRPGSINSLSLSNEVAFRALFSGQQPAMAERYWRGIVLEKYRGGTWSEAESAYSDPVTNSEFLAADVVDYTVLLEPSSRRWIFALDIPVQADSTTVQWHRGTTLRAKQSFRQRAMIDLSSATRYQLVGLSSQERLINTEIGEDVGPRVREMARDMLTRAADSERYIGMVLDYFRDNFVYSLTPPILGERALEQFLLETRTGYCEHFASAFSVLMRLAGIPSRVVTGYHGGEWNAQGDYLIIRQSDAHAWSEVWLPDSGWLRVDPTFAVLPERIEFGMDAVRLLQAEEDNRNTLSEDNVRTLTNRPWTARIWQNTRLFWDGINTRWYRWVIGYGADQQRRLLDWLGFEGGGMRALVGLMVGVISFLLLLQGWLIVRGRHKAEPLVRLYDSFCGKLSRAGLPRAANEGPYRYASRIERQRPDLAECSNDITRRYVALRYAMTGDEDDFRQLRQDIRRFRPGRRSPG